MLHVSPKRNKNHLLDFLGVLRKKAVNKESLLLLTTVFISFVPSIAQASCLIWTSWQPTRLTQQQCLNRAELALRNTGFTKGFAALESGVYGETGQYSGTIRCISSKGLAFFIVAGPSARTAQNLLTRLENNY
ncbi:hypothetical protein [Anabaena sp. CCY 9402-a]|uniref:hypothetical protein n=1 Tax=Anabaena sp. CCY 9402-a TaxID=3103867 RepID=UPI0039C5D79F